MKKRNLDNGDVCLVFVKYDSNGNEINRTYKTKLSYKTKRYAVMESGQKYPYDYIKTFCGR